MGWGKEFPSRTCPARNTIFLSLALGLAEASGARDIFIGVNALDYSGYPDCRPEFVAEFEKLANLGTKAGVEGEPFALHAPLQHMSKADIAREAARLGLDAGLSHSCYDPSPDGRACGACDACRLRARGFAEAGIDGSDGLRRFPSPRPGRGLGRGECDWSAPLRRRCAALPLP
jgi:Predicted PP-loop superfamily ATPase